MTAAPQALQDAIVTQQKDIGVLSWWVEEMEGHRGTGMQGVGYALPQRHKFHASAPHKPPEWQGPQQNGWDGEGGTKAGKVERKRE